VPLPLAEDRGSGRPDGVATVCARIMPSWKMNVSSGAFDVATCLSSYFDLKKSGRGGA
jgi:hypothetical protein